MWNHRHPRERIGSERWPWREMSTRGLLTRTESAAYSAQVPPAADRHFEAGQSVYVWREKKKAYVGPFPVERVEGSQLFLRDRSGTKA